MKLLKKFLIGIIITLSVLLGIVFSIGKLTIDNLNTPANNDFSSIIRDNVSQETRLVDIAMLGAHDVFSAQITSKSPWCPHDTSPFNNPVAMQFANGLISRMAKAQFSDTYTLLNRGVRYLDVRLTHFSNTWYTQHGLINGPLYDYLIQVINFLESNPGEFILFDIQHARIGNSSFNDLFTFMLNTKNENNLSIVDFINVDPNNVDLGELKLKDVTQNGSKAGVVILAKTDVLESSFHFNYFSSIRSTWHDQISTNRLIDDIESEYQALTTNASLARHMFRVNQAQTTPDFTSLSVFRTILSWSLLNNAQSHNMAILRHEQFDEWLSVMPIVMVDFADSSYQNFNYEIIQRINIFNKNLG